MLTVKKTTADFLINIGTVWLPCKPNTLRSSYSSLSTAMTLQPSVPKQARRVLAADPRAKGRKQTAAAAAFGKRLIHPRGGAGSTLMTKDTCSASAPTHCLLFTQQLVRHEPVVIVGEVSGLEGEN